MSLCLAVLLTAFGMALAAPSADELLGKAREKATKEGKSIFVDFSASW
jgi:hypothetical protein